MTEGAAFRLREYLAAGVRTYPRPFVTVTLAEVAADRIYEATKDRPARRPYRIQIVDAWTGEIVADVRPPPDPSRPAGTCIACGQPADPFAPPSSSGSRSGIGDGGGVA